MLLHENLAEHQLEQELQVNISKIVFEVVQIFNNETMTQPFM